MLPKKLDFFRKLKIVLSLEYRAKIQTILSLRIPGGKVLAYMNVYSCFVDICIRDIGAQYDGADILNSELNLNTQLSALIGFVYTHIDASSMTLYTYCNQYKMLFTELASSSNLCMNNINISDLKITPDIQKCIDLYKLQNPSKSLIKYYSGWTCENKSGRTFTIHLAQVYDVYGEEFTAQVYKLICDYAKKHKEETIRNKIYKIVSLFNEFTIHCHSAKDLENSLRPENSSEFMEKIMNYQFFRSLIKNNNPKTIINSWSETIKVFTDCFIDTGFYEEASRPFLCPTYKEPKAGHNGVSLGGKLNEGEKERWFVDIPLEIRDEDALKTIHHRLNMDLEHIKTVCQDMFEDIQFRLSRNIEFQKHGTVKELPKDVTQQNIIPMGVDALANTVATFYHHGFGIGSRTTTYLGFDAQGGLLLKELCLPTSQNLSIFAMLLVLEHPQITPSWFMHWEMYDNKGNIVGLRQVGTLWVAVSLKNRRGAHLAQQEIILTENSKKIIDQLIELTRFARYTLRELGGSNWRYTMLVADLQKACRPKNIGKLFTESRKSHNFLAVSSYNKNNQLILGLSDAKKLAPIVTLRTIRKAKAMQVYLETQSINSVSEMLGHKKLRMDLIERYLPQSLMSFFYDRWVRQFQNSIIYEALNDSVYLFDALDFDEKSLEVFLENHSLGNLPANLENINTFADSQQIIKNTDELVFTLSIPVFQVLIAIRDVIDSAAQEDVFKPVINRWYQSAVFILKHFALSLKGMKYRRAPDEVISFYVSALNSPLDLVRFKEQVLCRPR
jgi:hypothetical protein